ncbi:hypothetical protein PPUJ20005_12550 [Pseudomonas putida]|nr:hypothetical protein PPUJ20005_12550 [Pseudomonas putida]GLO26906.1 hypothetical protein PPUJ21368_47360 [Pseudomonas putida]
MGEPQAEGRLAATHLAVDRERIVQVFEKGFAHALSPSSGSRAGNQKSRPENAACEKETSWSFADRPDKSLAADQWQTALLQAHRRAGGKYHHHATLH